MADLTPVPLNARLQKDVVLVMDGKAFQMHANNVNLTPPTPSQVSFQGGTPQAKVTGSASPGGWVLNVTAVQDYVDPDSFANYCLEHAGEDVPVSYRPHRDSAVTFYTTATVQSPVIGGAVDGSTFNTFTIACPCETPSTTAPTT